MQGKKTLARPAAHAVAALALGLGLCSASVRAGTVYATSFEDPPFTSGAQLVGTDNWVGGPTFLSNAAATITNTVANTGTQSVQVRGADLVASGGPTDPYDAVGSFRLPVNYTVNPSGNVVRLEASLMLETANTAATPTDFFSFTIAARSGNGETLGEFGLSSAGIAAGYGFDARPGDAPAITSPVQFNTWYDLAVHVDFANHTTSYYLDNALLKTISAPTASNEFLRGAMVAYALPDAGGLSRSDYTAHFDDFSITTSAATTTAVPLPATVWPGLGMLALLSIGAAGRTFRLAKAT